MPYSFKQARTSIGRIGQQRKREIDTTGFQALDRPAERRRAEAVQLLDALQQSGPLRRLDAEFYSKQREYRRLFGEEYAPSEEVCAWLRDMMERY